MATWKGLVSTNSHSKLSAFMGKFSYISFTENRRSLKSFGESSCNSTDFQGPNNWFFMNIIADISVTYRLAHRRSHCTICTRRAGWYQDSTRGQQRSGFSTTTHKLCTWKLLFCCISWYTTPLSSLIKEGKQLRPVFRQGNTGSLFSASTLINMDSANLVPTFFFIDESVWNQDFPKNLANQHCSKG